MLIRSQDKGKLVNFNLIDGISFEENHTSYKIKAGVPGTENVYYVLGTYSTQAKVLKVLDIIQIAYQRYQQTLLLGMEGASILNPIFQMPNDEEVN